MELNVADTEFKSQVKELLHDSTVQNLCITFTKTDGTERQMLCTLAEQLIPSDKMPKGTGGSYTDVTQRVFDLSKSEWRSFRWDSVKSVTFEGK